MPDVAPLQTRPVEVIPDRDELVEPAAAKVLEARIYGTPIEALCGHVWVPSRDPKQLPLCEQCKSIYELYKSFNEDLPDQPSE
jgi:Protein of unknown function (DUF3039)